MINFMGPIDKVIEAFLPTLELLNLELFLKHIETCPDPTCGAVLSLDGTCKVFREICGQPREAPTGDEEGYDIDASDVHNVMANNYRREKVCDQTPTRGRGSRRCHDCTRRQERAAAARQAQNARADFHIPGTSPERGPDGMTEIRADGGQMEHSEPPDGPGTMTSTQPGQEQVHAPEGTSCPVDLEKDEGEGDNIEEDESDDELVRSLHCDGCVFLCIL